MAIAIIPQVELELFAKEIGFPSNHRMNLIEGGEGFKVFDEFIRKNVQWVQELGYDREKHIKIWTSSTIVGSVPKAHEYHSRSVMVGTENTNPFTDTASVCHANFIGSTVRLAQDWIADYKSGEDGMVAAETYIRVIVGTKSEDSYLGYGLNIPVEKIWNKHYRHDGAERFWLERSDYNPDEPIFEDVEYYYVRELTAPEVPHYWNFNEDTGKYERIREEGSTVHDVEFKSAEAIDLNNFSEDEDNYIAKQRGFEDNTDIHKMPGIPYLA